MSIINFTVCGIRLAVCFFIKWFIQILEESFALRHRGFSMRYHGAIYALYFALILVVDFDDIELFLFIADEIIFLLGKWIYFWWILFFVLKASLILAKIANMGIWWFVEYGRRLFFTYFAFLRLLLIMWYCHFKLSYK